MFVSSNRKWLAHVSWVLRLIPLILLPAVGWGEIYRCGKVYRSEPCQVERAVAVGEGASDGVRAQKRAIVLGLWRTASIAQREHISGMIAISGVESFCLGEETSREECQARASKIERDLIRKIQDERKFRQRERELTQRERELTFRREKLAVDRRVGRR